MSKEPLSITQTKVVKAKVIAELNDVPQSTAARKVFPNQTPAAAAVSMSRELKKANVQEAVQTALKKHGITIDSATKPIADGLKAMRTVFARGEDGEAYDVADHSIRLKASGMALKLMGAEQKTDEPKGNTFIFTKNSTFNSGEYKK